MQVVEKEATAKGKRTGKPKEDGASKKTTFKKEANQHVLEKATLKDVKVSGGPIHPLAKNVSKNQSCNKMTRLESILGYPVSLLSLDTLRSFGSKYGPTTRKNRKLDMAEQICDLQIEYANGKIQLDEDGNLLKQPVEAKKNRNRNNVNRKRLMNVMFGDKVRPCLLTSGEALTRSDLDNGIKTNEKMYRLIAEEYNNPDNYNEDQHPQIVTFKTSPELNDKPIVWEQVKKAMADMVKDYEIAHNNFKKSGNHGDFGEANEDKEFDKFIKNNQSLLYLHEMAHLWPHILEKITGKLPEGVFNESIVGGTVSKTVGASKKRKKSNNMEDWNRNAEKRLAMEAQRNEILRDIGNREEASREKEAKIKARSAKQEELIRLRKARADFSDRIIEQKKDKRKMFKEAEENSASRDKISIKKGYEKYAEERAAHTYEGADSQQSIFELIFECEHTIEGLQSGVREIENEMSLKESESTENNTEKE